MGGGHVSRPDFGMPQPDPNHPLTEFYLALQHALDKEGRLALLPCTRAFRPRPGAFMRMRRQST